MKYKYGIFWGEKNSESITITPDVYILNFSGVFKEHYNKKLVVEKIFPLRKISRLIFSEFAFPKAWEKAISNIVY